MTRVFVYGTLKRGDANHRYLSGQSFVGEARTMPLYRMFDLGGYPGIIEAAEDGYDIEGELWDVDAECLKRLDRLEGIDDGEYSRQVIELEPPYHTEPVEGYVYLRSVDGLREVGPSWQII